MTNIERKAVIHLIGGPADGLVFTIPTERIRPLVVVGLAASYRREPGDGEVICYRLVRSSSERRSSRRTVKSKLGKVDAHVTRPREYKELPELTKRNLSRAVVKKAARPGSRKQHSRNS